MKTEFVLRFNITEDWHKGDANLSDILAKVAKDISLAYLQMQDWFTPWTDVILEHEDYRTLLAYAQCFYFGE